VILTVLQQPSPTVLLVNTESEVRLIKRCRELNAEIVANAAKVQTALKLNEEDQGTISALKKEIEKAWKMVDASHEKEAKAKETIQQLKMEIANLTRLVEQGSGLALGEESTLNDLLKQKEELVRERDMQVDQIMALRAELMDTQVSA
jgi:chromosome segregation ATPase